MPDPAPRDHAGVAIPPPVIYIGFFAAGLLLDQAYPFPIYGVPRSVDWIVGGIFLVLWIVLGASAMREFRRAQTTVRPDKASTALIVGGPFRFTRNPLYLALLLLYVSAALAADTMWPILFLIPLLIVMHFGVIAREESYLESKFGDEYRSYRSRVRRWI